MARIHHRPWAAAALTLAMTAGGLAVAGPAVADILDPAACLAAATGSLAFDSTVQWGESTKLSWTTNLAATKVCDGGTPQIRLFEGNRRQIGPVLSATGSMTVTPTEHKAWTLELSIGTSSTKTLASVFPTVVPYPAEPLPAGTAVTISSNDLAERREFLRAIRTPGATIQIPGDVVLDLSGLDHVQVAPGVKVLGDRSVNPRGPRVFTTTYPDSLLWIGVYGAPSDNVRISGVRFDGLEPADPMASADTPDATAISIFSSQHIEIDHSEFARWRGFGVAVYDHDQRINLDNADTVWIHDNSIHDNQHPAGDDGHGAGYGIVLYESAYALIERNAFDLNRHSIAADGHPGTGYLAYRNLFERPGYAATNGKHGWPIDMHGTGCGQDGSVYNCGPAGAYVDLRYNTVTTTGAPAVYLRGTPSITFDVWNNVFAESADDTLKQNETGLNNKGGNVFSSPLVGDRKYCDFDGDGKLDPLLASGIGWWYQSSAADRWVFVNQSWLRLTEITLGDVNADGFCDIQAGGKTYYSPHTPDPMPVEALETQDQETLPNIPTTTNLKAVGGQAPYTWSVTGLPSGITATSTGVLSGVANGPATTVVYTVTDALGQTSTQSFTWLPAVTHVPALLGLDEYTAYLWIDSSYLNAVRKYTNDCLSPGDVVKQSPQAGRKVQASTEVTIWVSTCVSGGGGGGPNPNPKPPTWPK
ncbi:MULTISPECIES: right-handed parallel beta-helix repeat-containing protein [unclassified Actinoplanes]|uniref:right-handed parallel beta-helix repeat-containing protein n=1 Tax=unclassified Actinoplanes TaxID=2626549 RepID=UPI00031AAB67|nr:MULTISPECIES: right-handed parallel beta-helix repeat-containing protein [unclassified Actinoplanes]